MRARLEGDKFLFQVYNLAALHDWPVSVVRRMTLAEFYGWFAYHELEKEAVKRDG